MSHRLVAELKQAGFDTKPGDAVFFRAVFDRVIPRLMAPGPEFTEQTLIETATRLVGEEMTLLQAEMAAVTDHYFEDADFRKSVIDNLSKSFI